jgi:formamidopyrimidine-DNA glycosylase
VAVRTADDRIVYDGISPRRFQHVLKGAVVVAAHRKGKHLWLELDRRPWPVFHFGMTGGFSVYGSDPGRPRFMKCELITDDGNRLAMRNIRRLGRIRLCENPLAAPPVSRLGPDPLYEMPSPAAFTASLGCRRVPIKALLLNQAFLAGIGNWIADEVLYQAGIRPDRRAEGLAEDEARRLHRAIRRVIRRAVEVNAEKERFPRTWLFHHRWGKPEGARTARGEAIQFTTIGGRTTAWVPAVQR